MLSKLARLFRRHRTPASAEKETAKPAPNVDADTLLAAPMAAMREARRDEAIALLEAIVRDHPEFAEAHLLLGTILQQLKRLEDARDCFLLASWFRPEWWPPHYHQGLSAFEEGCYGDAANSFARAIELGATDARVHKALGGAYLHVKNPSGAVEEFRKALALRPDLASVHSDLGCVLFSNFEEYEEGAYHIQRALELAPDNAAALSSWIMVLHHRRDTEEALRIADELLTRDPQLVEARVNRALMLLTEGDFAGAWSDYEARKQLPRNTCTSDAPWAEWDGSALAGRNVFIYGEQGLGDEIMFASCVPDLAAQAGACILECHPKLVKLFSRSFQNVHVLAKDAWRKAPASVEPPPDFKIAIGSLPRIFRTSRSAFPAHDGYLRADPERVAYWKAQLATLPGHLKVGISWRGGLASSRRSLRSIALQQWLPIFAVPGIDFVSLQYSDPEGELDALQRAGVRVQQWQEAIDDYDETAALVCALDLVVSVQTAVVHLAGALGREVCALIPATPEWRYGSHGRSMPWYPTARLIRQPSLGDWGPVVETVAAELQAWTGPAR